MARYNQNDDTLQRIDEVANEDVRMKDAFVPDAVYLVVDTNILLHYLAVLSRFSEDIEAHAFPVLIIVPNVVISELDGLKKREELLWFASTASTWLLEKVKGRKSVKVQARRETCDTPIADSDYARKNDLLIYDCCAFFRTKGNVVLLSADKNLCITCLANGIPSVRPSIQRWSSRELARSLLAELNYSHDVSYFRGHEDASNFRPSRTLDVHRRLTAAPVQEDEDGMDIDDDGAAGDSKEDFIPTHALDSLHMQVIDHFAIVLKDVALRVRTATGDLAPPSQSQHAPKYRQKDFRAWTIGDCLEYLDAKKRLGVSRPSLRVFLLRRNEDRGWRRGQDWSRQDWTNSLEALEDVGTVFEDGFVLNSLAALRPEVQNIFNTPMRPTGL
ncbi:PIN domain-containing protein [Sparassis latifolia]